jgi:hypothetical protein
VTLVIHAGAGGDTLELFGAFLVGDKMATARVVLAPTSGDREVQF